MSLSLSVKTSCHWVSLWGKRVNGWIKSLTIMMISQCGDLTRHHSFMWLKFTPISFCLSRFNSLDQINYHSFHDWVQNRWIFNTFPTQFLVWHKDHVWPFLFSLQVMYPLLSLFFPSSLPFLSSSFTLISFYLSNSKGVFILVWCKNCLVLTCPHSKQIMANMTWKRRKNWKVDQSIKIWKLWFDHQT